MGARGEAFSAGVCGSEKGWALRVVENGMDEGAGLGDQERMAQWLLPQMGLRTSSVLVSADTARNTERTREANRQSLFTPWRSCFSWGDR